LTGSLSSIHLPLVVWDQVAIVDPNAIMRRFRTGIAGEQNLKQEDAGPLAQPHCVRHRSPLPPPDLPLAVRWRCFNAPDPSFTVLT
jgi:hypothetical protein